MNKLRKISAEQFTDLMGFTRKHFVEHYDLQCELADHLANAIEERWIINPDLDFNEALNIEFKKFGVFGFMDVVEQRQLALTKKYHRLMWSYFKQFFKLPKIAITILLIFGIFKSLEYSVTIYTTLLLIVTFAGIYRLVAMNIKYKKRLKQTGRRWLFEDIIMRCGGVAAFIYIPYQVLFHAYDNIEPGIVAKYIMTLLLAAFSLYLYTVLYIIPTRAQEHLLKTYPEYNL
jgi:hypothetical protein